MLIIIVGILSIVLSLIYYVILKKLNAWYIGALYGFVIWILLYNGIPFLLRGNFIVTHYSVHTHINALCLFVLYGSFVGDRKSTRLNSSHVAISYAVFCLTKKSRYLAPNR